MQPARGCHPKPGLPRGPCAGHIFISRSTPRSSSSVETCRGLGKSWGTGCLSLCDPFFPSSPGRRRCTLLIAVGSNLTQDQGGNDMHLLNATRCLLKVTVVGAVFPSSDAGMGRGITCTRSSDDAHERDANWTLNIESLWRKRFCIDGPQPCRSETCDKGPSLQSLSIRECLRGAGPDPGH